MSPLPKRTVQHEIRNILPLGTNPPGHASADHSPNWDAPPVLPTDLFAVAAHLVKVAGLVAWFDPSPDAPDDNRRIRLGPDRRQDLLKAAEAWRNHDTAEVKRLWQRLLAGRETDILRPRQLARIGDMSWCQAVVELLIIADEAAGELMRTDPDLDKDGGLEQMIRALNRPEKDDKGGSIVGSTLKRREKHPPSVTYVADTDVVCVLPKGRIAQVGCTLRGFSKNLALLPSRASVRAQWSEPGGDLKAERHGTLDILLVPMPFRLDAENFVTKPETSEHWGNFSLRQNWLSRPSGVVKLVDQLIRAASRQTAELNAVVFPEYALDWTTFALVHAHIQKHHPAIEFVIAGASVNCEGIAGNHVLTAVRQDISGRHEFAAVSRRKHHRWRLTPDQLRTYGLTPVLNPGVAAWWETHDVETRELYFHRFRKSSIFVAMICEDLARDDPCHEILRSVGPNIVFALLMDGPQLPARWGARYAGGLADDPGSSVLTFTSWGLIKRANDVTPAKASRTVAMWKDDTGEIHEIPMPAKDENSGILLSLAAKEVTERTIDGRETRNWSWRFNGQYPVIV